MTLNTNALISLPELQVYLGARALGAGSGSLDRAVEDRTASGSYTQGINQSSQYVQSFIGYNLFSGSLRSDIFDGRGYNPQYDFYHDSIQVSRPPIVGTPRLYYRCSGNTWTLSTHTYDWDSITGAIWLTDSGYFGDGTRNWKVEYAYGYTSVGSVPADLKLAACMIAQYVLKIGEEGQVASATTGDITRSYTLKIPREALMILDRYKR